MRARDDPHAKIVAWRASGSCTERGTARGRGTGCGLQCPEDAAALAHRLRRQAPVDWTTPPAGRTLYVVCTRDAAVKPEWQRRAAACCDRVVEIDAGHSPMLTHVDALADIVESGAREAGVV
jgi:pimeloyl-ACP methyl ester carboxylesterase